MTCLLYCPKLNVLQYNLQCRPLINGFKMQNHNRYLIVATHRFGQIFFKADRTLSMDELQAEFLVNNVEKDGLIDLSMPLGSTHWTFVTM